MSRTLMPPNATALERAFDLAYADRLDAIELPFPAMKHPLHCDVELLAYLAWERSVDFWVTDWAENVKRAIVNGSTWLHAHKGTPGSIRRALWLLGHEDLTIWEPHTDVTLAPFTFRIELSAPDGISAEEQTNVLFMVLATKRESAHLTEIAVVGPTLDAPIHTAVVVSGGDVTTLETTYP